MLTFHPGGIAIDGRDLAPIGVKVLGGLLDVLPPYVRSYEAEVEHRLKEIAARQVGRFVLGALTKTGKKLVIVPYVKDDAKTVGRCNAFSSAADDEDSAPQGVRYYNGRFDDPNTPRDERFNRRTVGMGPFERHRLGTGKGSDAEIHYTDSMWKAGACCSVSTAGNAGDRPDEVLLHEIVHALRAMQGKRNPIPTVGTARPYDNEEEFFAVLVTNIYMSEKCSVQLRASHHGFAALKPPLNTSAGFLGDAENRRLVKKLAAEASGLFLDLLGVTGAAFNPVREYLMDRAKHGG